jgi:hypothetical protein
MDLPPLLEVSASRHSDDHFEAAAVKLDHKKTFSRLGARVLDALSRGMIG